MNEPRYKRPLDLAILLFAHLLLLPLWALLWLLIPLAVLLDDGRPIFYRQRRVGQGGRIFHALKFRTMVRNADTIGPAWTSPRDPRLTRVGRLLRGTALDELPQVVNILRGDMSFVGPRALAQDEFDLLKETVPGFEQRCAVRPGLTGLAQVHGDRADSRQKLEYDLQYIQGMGLWVDLRLVLLSGWITLRGTWEKPGRKV
ncbi:MAG: sugar transferase [Chloroflexi bacterium]|nr:sugar transferase [Chloroflexota bacterium]